MSRVFRFSFLLPGVLAAWQNSTSPSAAPTFAQPSGYETKVYNVSAATATISYSYTNEELAMLWNQVGKIEKGLITTTVIPTPEPSAYPRPGAFHPLVGSPIQKLYTQISTTIFRCHPPTSRSPRKNFQMILYGVLRPAHIKLREQPRMKEKALRFGIYSHIAIMDLFPIIRLVTLLEVITIFTSRTLHVWRN